MTTPSGFQQFDGNGLRFTRSARSSRVVGATGIAVVIALAALPYVAFPSVTTQFSSFFVLVILGSMWNLLAGFGGLVSVGQQAYVGLGAYTVVAFADLGVNPFVAIILAVVTTALIALPTSFLAFRLRGDYFAVGTWVIAEVYRLLIVKIPALGGPSGDPLPGLTGIVPAVRDAYVYWAALVVAAVTVFGIYLLLRGRTGLGLTAVRDDETAARSVGVNVTLAKRVTYLVSAGGCGAAGALLVINALSIQPDAIFSVQWSAYMIFIVVIGGIGYIEGPILGAIVFFVLQQTLSSLGTWYLIILGAIAIACAIWLPRGLWGFIVDRTGFRLFPVGYFVQTLAEPRTRRNVPPLKVGK
jgi:branched-chain amino acid transport system permease protein